MSLDVLRARVAFRDRAFIDVMDLALRFVVVHGWLYAKIALMSLAPCVAIASLAAWSWGWIAGWCVAIALSFVAQVPFTVLASRLVFQERVRAAAVMRAAAREIPRVVVMRGAWAAGIGVGLVFLVAPALLIAALVSFVDEVMILERARILPAFARSQRIAFGALGDALASVAMVCLVPLVAVFMADVGGRAFLGELLQFRAPAPLWAHGGSVLALLGFFAVVPYVTTARFFAYLNARTRAEGWDIQTRFAAIAARAEQDEAT